MFAKQFKFWPKIKILAKKSKCLLNNSNFGQKIKMFAKQFKFWPKIQILAKKSKCLLKNSNFGQKSKFY